MLKQRNSALTIRATGVDQQCHTVNLLTQPAGIQKSGFLILTFFLPVTFHSFRISTALPAV